MITLQIDQIDDYQRNAYGTTDWTTDYAGRNPVEGVNGMIKNDGTFNPASCRVFGLAAHTLAALMAAVVHNLNGVPPVGWTLGLCGRVMVVVVLPFVWWLLSDRGVKPAGVVPGFDPPSDR